MKKKRQVLKKSNVKAKQSVSPFKKQTLKKLAEMLAKNRGQLGRGISQKDMQSALQMLKNKNKKFKGGK